MQHLPSNNGLRRLTEVTRKRYNRIAPLYDWMEALIERSRFQAWRSLLWSQVSSGRILEIGVGTGKNMPFYPSNSTVIAVDLSERMLVRAAQRAQELPHHICLCGMDAQFLAFPDNTFDTAVATFVFCSVPDPILGLREVARVVKPGGDIWLLEHVRVDKPIIGPVMDVLNPFVVRVVGANINRRTVENVRRAGLEIVEVRNLSGELVKLIHARPPNTLAS